MLYTGYKERLICDLPEIWAYEQLLEAYREMKLKVNLSQLVPPALIFLKAVRRKQFHNLLLHVLSTMEDWRTGRQQKQKLQSRQVPLSPSV